MEKIETTDFSEKDVPKIKIDQKALVYIEALDAEFEAKVADIARVSQTVSRDVVFKITVELDGQPAGLRWGMSADVEIVAGEAKNALLVPAQALRELAPGSFAVFVVGADDQLKLTPVTVGLRDFANVQILTGLKAGDVVSTGTVETK